MNIQNFRVWLKEKKFRLDCVRHATRDQPSLPKPSLPLLEPLVLRRSLPPDLIAGVSSFSPDQQQGSYGRTRQSLLNLIDNKRKLIAARQ